MKQMFPICTGKLLCRTKHEKLPKLLKGSAKVYHITITSWFMKQLFIMPTGSDCANSCQIVYFYSTVVNMYVYIAWDVL